MNNIKMFNLTVLAVVTMSSALISGSGLAKKNLDGKLSAQQIKARDDKGKEDWAYSLGVQAYIYGLPLKVFDRERRLRLNKKKLSYVMAKKICPCAPLNTFGHMTKLATAADDLPYTPNNDTIYSGILLELKAEPIIVTLPDVTDRYWSAQITDAYLENQPYLGSRANTGKGGHFMFVGPDWQGRVPADVTLRRMSTNSGLIALRYSAVTEIPGDVAEVLNIQRQVHTTGLSFWGKQGGFGKVNPVTMYRKNYQGELAFFEQMSDLLADNPPKGAARDAMVMFKGIGIELGNPFNPAALDPLIRKGLVRAIADAPGIMQWNIKTRGTTYESGWVNVPEGQYGLNFINRAAGAVAGLIVHDYDEGIYFSTYEDGKGNLLDGSQQYILHFEKDEIPALTDKGFWSLTMYGTNYRLVDNESNRFAIGDRTPGLKYNQDGSLTLYIQNKAPLGHESNWLPSPPEGLFRIIYRIYTPDEKIRNSATVEKFIPGLKKGNIKL